jgi:hypothetical protein
MEKKEREVERGLEKEESLSYLIVNLDAIQFFINNGIDPSGEDNRALRTVCKNPLPSQKEAISLLLSDLRVNPCANSHEPLRNAINHQAWDVVQLLLSDKRMDLSSLTEEVFTDGRLPPSYVA